MRTLFKICGTAKKLSTKSVATSKSLKVSLSSGAPKNLSLSVSGWLLITAIDSGATPLIEKLIMPDRDGGVPIAVVGLFRSS